jgi:hypothetical protein
MIGSKFDRQLRMQRLAVEVIRQDPSLLSDSRLLKRLGVISAGTNGDMYRRVLAQWVQLIRSGDIEVLSHALLADTESGAYLRTTSPLGVVLTPEQRDAVVSGRQLVAA